MPAAAPASPFHAALPWHQRLEARVAVGVTVLVAATLALLLFGTSRIVQQNALARAQTDLAVTQVAFGHLVDSRARAAATQLRMVTELPVFRAYLQEPRLAADAASLHAMADDYRRALDAAFVVVTNREGTWMASPGWNPATAPPPRLRTLVSAARAGTPGRGILVQGGRLFLTVTQPAQFAEETLATVTAGFRLDDDVARELAATARSEVLLLSDGQVAGSSLPATSQRAARDLLAMDANALGRPGGEASVRAIGGTHYVTGVYGLALDTVGAAGATLALLQDWRTTQASIDQVTGRMLQVGGLIFAVALAGGMLVSRRITRPLADMARVAGDVATGHWDRQVPVRGRDETAALATAFNAMTRALGHWRAEAQARTAEVQDAYERFAAVAHSANDAIVSTDEHGVIEFWNRSAARIFGEAESAAVGRPFAAMLEDDSALVWAALAARLARGDRLPEEVIALTARRQDGVRLPVEVSLASWTARGTQHVTAIIRDISDRRQAEAILRQREADLRQAQKMDAIGRLAGGVAHDFNNLLTAIRGYAEFLVDALPPGTENRDDAEQIVKASDTAGSLTRQLLAFSRKQILAPTVMSLGDTVRGMEKMLRRLIGEDIELTVDIDADAWPVRADAGQLEQVVLNLVVNARDAMPTGGRLELAVHNLRAPGDGPGEGLVDSAARDRIVLSVRDDGSGMDADTLAHIFEPFFTTKGEGRGTGLGLATVDGIVGQSGGTLSVDSAPGRGTCFRILLPRAVPPPDVQAPQREAAEPGTGTVLLVEDEPGVRRFVGEILMRLGYHVLEADRGDHALEAAAAYHGPIHLLLTDVVMPVMSGRVLWERLQAVRPDVRVLFMSGYTDDAVVRHGILQSELPFLQKPFTGAALTQKVGHVLAGEVRGAD